MKRRLLAIGMLLALLLTASGCESESDRANRELDEARQRAEEARQRMIDSHERLDLLESLFGN